LIKSEFGKTFGGFAQPSWDAKKLQIFGTGKSFVFQLDYNIKHKYLKNAELIGTTKNLEWSTF
jgi:hypothetical protein